MQERNHSLFGMYEVSEGLEKAGLQHAFTGVSFCRGWDALKKWGNAEEVLALNQVHSATCIEVNDTSWSTEHEGDAFIVQDILEKPVVLSLRTADCLPIILYQHKTTALIHAGWRGLASGIVEKALSFFDPHVKLLAAIGPSASCARYVVGEELRDAFGERGVFEERASELYLDCAGTAKGIIERSFKGQVNIDISKICTIADRRFFSHRREPKNEGRNYTFVVPVPSRDRY